MILVSLNGKACAAHPRRKPVRCFRRFILFYCANDAGVEIIRVLHGAREVESIFRDEERDEPREREGSTHPDPRTVLFARRFLDTLGN